MYLEVIELGCICLMGELDGLGGHPGVPPGGGFFTLFFFGSLIGKWRCFQRYRSRSGEPEINELESEKANPAISIGV
jgi:hypothetical protein